ncbi:MAG TPA: hypothetical protein VJY54_13510 [Lachnospiraceae bacterium]|nr:hypothetical protein [Lachnospiraceae bacterium]
MKIKRRLFFLVFVVVFLCQTQNVMACTVFSVTLDDGTVLSCNNEDWMYSIGNTVKISEPDSESYGRVCFYNSSYVQGGMNEYGLFYDGASCPATEVPYDKEKKDLGYDLGETALAKCKTVKEVEEFFSGYNIPNGFCDHLLFADALGNVAVFEWVEDKFHVIWKDAEKKHQVITNFWLSDPTLGGYPCSRYNMVEEALSTEETTFELCESILNKAKQDWGDGGTLYSNICNLSEREVYLFYRGDQKQTYQINLINELETMDPGTCEMIDMQELCCGETLDEKEAEKREVLAIDLELEDNNKTTYEVIPIIVVILIVVAIIIKKHMRK